MVLTGLNRNTTIEQLRDKILFLLDELDAAIVRVVNENNSDFNAASNEVKSNVITIITSNTIGESFIDLFSAYDLVGNTARDRYLLAKELFFFGDSDTDINDSPDLTAALNAIDLWIQINAMYLAFDNAANIEFDNEDDLNEVIESLQSQYDRIINDVTLDSDTRLALINLKTATIGLFTNLDLRSITTINTTVTPSTVLSYRYYGDSTFSDNIVALNKAYNTGFIEGDVRILSED